VRRHDRTIDLRKDLPRQVHTLCWAINPATARSPSPSRSFSVEHLAEERQSDQGIVDIEEGFSSALGSDRVLVGGDGACALGLHRIQEILVDALLADACDQSEPRTEEDTAQGINADCLCFLPERKIGSAVADGCGPVAAIEPVAVWRYDDLVLEAGLHLETGRRAD